MSYIDYRQFQKGEKPRNFSYALNMLVERLMADDTITQSEMTVCLALAKCCHQGDGQCFPKVKTVMLAAKVSERTFRTCLNTLEAKGYIERKARHRADGAQSSNIYIIPMMKIAAGSERIEQLAQIDTTLRHEGIQKCRAINPTSLGSIAKAPMLTECKDTALASATDAGPPCNDCTPNKKDPFKKEISLSTAEIFTEQAQTSRQEERDELSIIQRKKSTVASHTDRPARLHQAPKPQSALLGQRRMELPAQDTDTERRYLVDLSLLGIGITPTDRGDDVGLPLQAAKASDRHRELCSADC
jgi:hypothetical protein